MANIFQELKRRNVFRVTIAYLVVSWGILEVSEILIGLLGLPDWSHRLIFVILIIGIVPVLIAAWALELTPDGIKLDTGETPPESWRKERSGRLHRFTIGVLVFIIALLLVERLYFAQPGTEPIDDRPASSAERSVAVLPFDDYSQQQDQQWFADGLSEEITNALARMPDIMVAARQTAMLYRGTEKDVATIGRELGVAHVLEGSIRNTETNIRVTAQLIRVSDGFNAWSQTYDRSPDDVIRIQEDVALQIATALDTTLSPEALEDMAAAGTRSVRAYQAYIRGLALRSRSLRTSDWSYLLEAYEQFETARGIDPKFSAAHREAAEFWLVQVNPARRDNGLTDLEAPAMYRNFMERIDLAVDTAKDEAERSGARAQRAVLQLRLRNALRRFSEYLEARPNDLQAWGDMLLIARMVNDSKLIEKSLEVLWREAARDRASAARYVSALTRLGDPAGAAEFGMNSRQRWPNDAALAYETHRALLWAGRVEEAGRLLSNIDPIVSDGLMIKARQFCAEQRRDDVLAILEELRRLPRRRVTEEWLILSMLDEHEQAREVLAPYDEGDTQVQLAFWLTYPSFDPSPHPFLMQMLERENIDRPPAVPIPFACPEVTGSP